MGELKVIGTKPMVLAGDVVKEEISLTWHKGNADEIAQAAKVFQEYINKGWMAVCEVGGGMKQIFKFDQELELITLVPLDVGG